MRVNQYNKTINPLSGKVPRCSLLHYFTLSKSDILPVNGRVLQINGLMSCHGQKHPSANRFLQSQMNIEPTKKLSILYIIPYYSHLNKQVNKVIFCVWW